RQTRYRSSGLRSSRYKAVTSQAPAAKRESGKVIGKESPLMGFSGSRLYSYNNSELSISGGDALSLSEMRPRVGEGFHAPEKTRETSYTGRTPWLPVSIK